MASPLDGPGDPLTANDQLVIAAVRRAALLERTKNLYTRELVGFLNDELFPDLVARLQSRLERIRLRGFDSGVATTQRYQDMVDSLARMIVEEVDKAQGVLRTHLEDLAVDESAQLVKSLAAAAPVALDFVGPNVQMLRAIASEHPLRGKTLGEWFEKLGADLQSRLTQQVSIGLAQSETIPQIVQRIRGTDAANFEDGVLQVSRREAEAIARTAATDVATQARSITAAENDDIVKGEQWVATLDTRTCPICGALDGQMFAVGEGPMPAAHPNCRCTRVPVLKSWKELGISLSEAPPGTRASMNGQVSEKLTFADWIEQEPAAIQDEILGPARAKLLRAGELSLGDFVDERRGRILTLQQIAALQHPN